MLGLDVRNTKQPLSVEEIYRSSFLCRPSAAEDGYQAGGGGRPCVGVHLLASLVVSAGGLALQGQQAPLSQRVAERAWLRR